MLDHNRNSDALAIAPVVDESVVALDRGDSDIGTSPRGWGSSENLQGMDVAADAAAVLEVEQANVSQNLLDLSRSWCPKLHIPKSAFDTVAPSRQKTKMYHKC